MECLPSVPDDAVGYLGYFRAKMARLHVPVNGSLELTRRCNLRCVHCYARPEQPTGLAARRELTTRQICAIIDDVAAAGCLDLLLTGGEPLLRRDFAEIYRHAITRGLLVTVFTNGTLVSDETVALFREFPPQRVEISVYGATAATCAAVTGVASAHQRCIAGIEALIAGGVRVALKTMLLSCNAHEAEAIEELARRYGVKFRLDAALFPRLDGDRAPLAYRIDPAEAVAREFGNSERAQAISKFYARAKDATPATLVYECGAGVNHFHVDAYGTLRPCLMTADPSYLLAGGRFEEGWREIIPQISAKKIAADNSCRACDKRSLCGYCPSFFLREQGHDERKSPYLCALGHHRHRTITAAAAPQP